MEPRATEPSSRAPDRTLPSGAAGSAGGRPLRSLADDDREVAETRGADAVSASGVAFHALVLNSMLAAIGREALGDPRSATAARSTPAATGA